MVSFKSNKEYMITWLQNLRESFKEENNKQGREKDLDTSQALYSSKRVHPQQTTVLSSPEGKRGRRGKRKGGGINGEGKT